MSDNYFQPWLSDKEPRVPSGWGLDAIRRSDTFSDGFKCDKCGELLKLREQYLYRYTSEGVSILHNKKECCESLIV